jgi:microcompartment protein CcmK/EutM
VKLARVVGTVVSTIQHASLDGRRLLVCDLLTPTGTATGSSLIAVDAVGAGAGELVLILDEGSSARQILALPNAPIRAVVAAIVDELALA